MGNKFTVEKAQKIMNQFKVSNLLLNQSSRGVLKKEFPMSEVFLYPANIFLILEDLDPSTKIENFHMHRQ
jgi:hypothetical protein